MSGTEPATTARGGFGADLLARGRHLLRLITDHAAVRRVFGEPLTHFVLAGAALFLISGWAEQHFSRYRIEMGPQQAARLAAAYEQQYGAPPSEAQLALLRDHWLREEILYREALALGLDRDDEIVRRRLAQKFEFLQQDLAASAPPTADQVRAYYEAHLSAYAAPARRTFTHLYFSPDRGGDDAAQRRAASALAQVRASNAPPAADIFSGPANFAEADAASIVRVFGGELFARSIFDAPVGVWSGPFRSGLGWHLVLVQGVAEATTPPLSEIEARVRRDFENEQRQRANDAAFAEIASRSTIVDRTARE